MSNFFIAIIRSLIPIIVGWIVGLLVSVNVHLDPSIAEGAIASASALSASLYYLGVVWLERKYSWFGWLLGVARNPVYAAAPRHSA
ncbi:hypothetical protein QN345_00445 [Cryobacterium sp. 10I1]|uniref:hypothetical protein n=1 Tax=unclassified Cryobacterium TaxID=2649013 RepID=UPI002B23C08A|nr:MULTISPECIES: hypothetical protein [unclassified Cryobacterium]MEB0001594.1 hypothetical protein [Cryobacterium sp. RTC2.1]MEB0303808.1 hypothetical protein [Cryobacterium sp. 10I1]